ncbi:MAG: PEGA domain-containing protein [Anaerolineae bacterium]|nr:PEGA domain-containing protein [Anaerolineae bacterium]
MKNLPIISGVGLMLWLVVATSCQPTAVENLRNNSENITPVNSLQEDEMTGEQEPSPTPTRALAPTVTLTPEVMATSTPVVTQVPTAVVHIISEPEGALASVIDNDLSGETPISWALPPGTYSVTLALTGYEEWITSITIEAGSQITLTPTLRQHHTIVPIEDLSGPLWNLRWSDDGQSLMYSLSDEQWPYHVRLLPAYQSWWRYDVSSGTKQALPSPQTRITNSVRESLGICPYPLPEALPYPCSSNFYESPTSNRIVFESEKLSPTVHTWLADVDGSNLILLELSDSPQDVMWSSDGQWLLIGNYWGGDGNLYTLVSSDGTVIKNLEELTNTSHYRVHGPTPQFSPDGQKLAFVGIETGGRRLPTEQLDQIDAYNLYILDLNTLEYQMVSPRAGLFHWANEGSGLYILDGALQTPLSAAEDMNLGRRILYTDLYYIDLTQESFPEQKLASDIPVHLTYSWEWAYSPEARAMVGIFDLEGPVFGILFLK